MRGTAPLGIRFLLRGFRARLENARKRLRAKAPDGPVEDRSHCSGGFGIHVDRPIRDFRAGKRFR